MLGMEELKANAAEVKSRIASGHGWDGHLFSGLLSWYCPVSNGHGAKQRVVSIILYSPLLLSQETNRAKYPIAAADKLIHTSGANILFAYDIGCMFSATLSKLLIGELASDFNFHSCTGSFHGAAHNQHCQLCFHIGLIEGAGMDNGEGNEQLFSASNALAAVVCHATAYHQHLHIHIHFDKWDQDKYEHLGKPVIYTAYPTLQFLYY